MREEAAMARQRQSLPDEWMGLDAELLAARIRAHKERLGDQLLILGHHYQKQDVIEHADRRGDSYGLAKDASQSNARWIVFCGVEFMADSARLLARPEQTVIHPDTSAGCPMADMADQRGTLRAWTELESELGTTAGIIPVTYVNSDVETKAFTGARGGAVCTSSNAGRVFDWALARGEKLFFFPDEHLGRNTAFDKGFHGGEVALWNPALPLGGLTGEQVRQARVLLWKGFCHVHTHFTVKMIEAARAETPGLQVIVHPECLREVVAAADAAGSTAFILDWVRAQPAGSRIRVGTELNLVQRLQLENPDKEVRPLDRSLCPNMWKISPNDLLWVLDRLGEVNVVEIEPELVDDARLALERMLAV
jgi:quinolinate synthase